MTAHDEARLSTGIPVQRPAAGQSPGFRRLGVVALVAVLMVGCASRTRAPVDDRTAPAAPVPSPA
ncbi:MAG TPA: hypothetical protein PLW68_11345, partial [Casimicrobiaceae bacterium]|nr:hypothetical protein [Casimicrobiaceae bacterium]